MTKEQKLKIQIVSIYIGILIVFWNIWNIYTFFYSCFIEPKCSVDFTHGEKAKYSEHEVRWKQR